MGRDSGPGQDIMDLVFSEFPGGDGGEGPQQDLQYRPRGNISLNNFITGHFNDTIIGFTRHNISDKSLSLLGVISGFVLLLLFMAFITCIRQRKIYQGYVEARDPRRLYRVYCQLEDVVYTINEEKEVTPPDYESVVTADLQDLPNYEQAVQQYL